MLQIGEFNETDPDPQKKKLKSALKKCRSLMFSVTMLNHFTNVMFRNVLFLSSGGLKKNSGSSGVQKYVAEF